MKCLLKWFFIGFLLSLTIAIIWECLDIIFYDCIQTVKMVVYFMLNISIMTNIFLIKKIKLEKKG